MQVLLRQKDNLGHTHSLFSSLEREKKNTKICECGSDVSCKNEINCLTKQFTKGINREREGTKWKPLKESIIAKKLNFNPATAKDMGARKVLLKKCKESGFTKIFFYFC